MVIIRYSYVHNALKAKSPFNLVLQLKVLDYYFTPPNIDVGWYTGFPETPAVPLLLCNGKPFRPAIDVFSNQYLEFYRGFPKLFYLINIIINLCLVCITAKHLILGIVDVVVLLARMMRESIRFWLWKVTTGVINSSSWNSNFLIDIIIYVKCKYVNM